MPILYSNSPVSLRRKHLKILLCIALTAFFIAILLLKYSHALARQGRMRIVVAQQRLSEAVQREDVARRASERARLGREFLGAATRSGFASHDWDERRFNFKQLSMTRQAVNAMLTEVRRTPGHLFSAEQFDVSVKQQTEGLFYSPQVSNSELLVTLKGTTLFRTEKDNS